MRAWAWYRWGLDPPHAREVGKVVPPVLAEGENSVRGQAAKVHAPNAAVVARRKQLGPIGGVRLQAADGPHVGAVQKHAVVLRHLAPLAWAESTPDGPTASPSRPLLALLVLLRFRLRSGAGHVRVPEAWCRGSSDR